MRPEGGSKGNNTMTEQLGVKEIQDNARIQENTPQTHLYLVFIWGAVSAETHGPYLTLEDRDQAARDIMGGEMDDHSIHTLDITTAADGSVTVEAGDYTNSIFEEDAEEEDAEVEVLESISKQRARQVE